MQDRPTKLQTWISAVKRPSIFAHVTRHDRSSREKAKTAFPGRI